MLLFCVLKNQSHLIATGSEKHQIEKKDKARATKYFGRGAIFSYFIFIHFIFESFLEGSPSA